VDVPVSGARPVRAGHRRVAVRQARPDSSADLLHPSTRHRSRARRGHHGPGTCLPASPSWSRPRCTTPRSTPTTESRQTMVGSKQGCDRCVASRPSDQLGSSPPVTRLSRTCDAATTTPPPTSQPTVGCRRPSMNSRSPPDRRQRGSTLPPDRPTQQSLLTSATQPRQKPLEPVSLHSADRRLAVGCADVRLRLMTRDDGRQYLAQFYKKVVDRDVPYRGAGPSLTALSTIRWHIDASGAQRHPAHSCLLG